MTQTEIVETRTEAAQLESAPLLILESIAEFLDVHALGTGPIAARRLGEGNSNVTYLIQRGDQRLVLRRPPRPPLPPSAHDMLREARVQMALRPLGARVPRILAVCEDDALLGVPFYMLEYLPGLVITNEVPPSLAALDDHRRIGLELVDALVEIHAVDWRAAGLADFGRPTGYLERQIRRFSSLWEVNATRELAQVQELADWLERHRPESSETTVVHGDYRLGNVMFASTSPARLIAVLDWELSTLGDPLADVGYLAATYTDATSLRTPLELSPITGEPGFPSRQELVAFYEERSGRSAGALSWYQTLALWKAAVFCEAIYGRWLRGEKAAEDPFASSLDTGVPRLLEAAESAAAG